MEKYILFTGLIRNENEFLRKLEISVKLRKESVIDGIIFSTWLNEIKKYKNVYNYLKKNNIIIIENKEPKLKFSGYIYHQKLSLRRGLELISEKAYVFKARPDLGLFNKNTIKSLFSNDYNFNPSILKGWPKIFEQQITIFGGFLFHPFYINDIEFFGLRDDLMKLTTFDLKYESDYCNIAPEQFFFFHLLQMIFQFLIIFLEFIQVFFMVMMSICQNILS